ncbi:hypothetical protein AVEN_252534-1 [Araneus ventricosus]|uniref:Uncharacterized protein n=1 Tax=Araneus ventricosus TaxID=182803 RepID=A0A4Y2AR06_ARAVE|nr:hypothetical protein AVEN_252534-1 [Araneus ventricosus]
MPPTVRRMVSFSSTRVVGEPRYTRDFKYPHNQKSAGVKSGDREGHLNLQPQLITPFSVKVCNRNVLTSRAKWGGAPSYMKVTTGNMSFLQYRHNVVTQKRNLPFCSDCTGFPAGYRTTLFKKERAQYERRGGNHTKQSHEENAVAWSGTHEGLTSPRYDYFAY